MKKILSILSCITLTFSLCACGGQSQQAEAPQEIPVLDPAELITQADVQAIAGYYPVTDLGTERSGNTSTLVYRSEPLGDYDTVTIGITQFDDNLDYTQIFNMYETGKNSRSDAEMIESLGQEAYIAFPSIFVYDRGCLLQITAGSGADDTQKSILTNLAMIAAGRLEEAIPEYTGNN